MRREAFENSQNSSLPAAVRSDQELAPVIQRTVSFTEIKLQSSPQNTAPIFHPDFVIRKGDLILEIANSASDELLSRIGGILDGLYREVEIGMIHFSITEYFESRNSSFDRVIVVYL